MLKNRNESKHQRCAGGQTRFDEQVNISAVQAVKQGLMNKLNRSKVRGRQHVNLLLERGFG